MPTGAERFDNTFKRLDVELVRLRRIGVPTDIIDVFREKVLNYRPPEVNQLPPPAVDSRVPTTPYALAVNRFQGFKEDKYTWSYFLEAWDQCSPDDQIRLNELTAGG